MSVSSVRQIARDLLTLQNNGVLGSSSLRSSFTSSHFSFDPNSSFVSESDNNSYFYKSTSPDINNTKNTSYWSQTTINTINNKYDPVDWQSIDNYNKKLSVGEYSLNEDNKPKIIKKKTIKNLEYIQDVVIRNLRPPTPPLPGEIFISQEPNKLAPPAPPIIIRQQPPRPNTPDPIILREAPPKPPPNVGRKVITISGKKLPPPPRKVVVERLAPIPARPPAIIAERWLPYKEVKRRVIFKPAPPDPIFVKPRNIVVQWKAPNVKVKPEVRYLGVVKADPINYIQKYQSQLKLAKEFPECILNIKPPDGLVLAADSPDNYIHELEGEIDALKLIDLEYEGLTDYLPQLKKSSSRLSRISFKNSSQNLYEPSQSRDVSISSTMSAMSSIELVKLQIIDQIFNELDTDKKGYLSVKEAERVLLKLNTRLGRSYGEDDLKDLLTNLDADEDNGQISLEKFRIIFRRVL